MEKVVGSHSPSTHKATSRDSHTVSTQPQGQAFFSSNPLGHVYDVGQVTQPPRASVYLLQAPELLSYSPTRSDALQFLLTAQPAGPRLRWFQLELDWFSLSQDPQGSTPPPRKLSLPWAGVLLAQAEEPSCVPCYPGSFSEWPSVTASPPSILTWP